MSRNRCRYDVWEGEKMIEAAHRYNKIVQAGTQSRSSHGIKEAVEWVQKGNLGKIRVARALCYKPRPSIGKTVGPQAVPATVDYDLWCGPAPLTPPAEANFITTGIGFGIMARAIWATKASTKWMWRAGSWVKDLVAARPLCRRTAWLRG
jgi:hypothetical protein